MAILYGFQRPSFFETCSYETDTRGTQEDIVVERTTPALRRVSISVPVTILLMLSACTYYSFDTPYTLILTTIFGVRTCYMLVYILAFCECSCVKSVLSLNQSQYVFLL